MQFKLRHIFIVVSFGSLVGCTPGVGIEITEQSPTTAIEMIPTLAIEPTSTTAIEQIPTIEGAHNSWKLSWQDEFNNSDLNENDWVADVNDWGGGNKELQYYTDRSENVYVENGLLHIVGRKETYRTREYTSARLTSARAWKYGRFEVKAQLPRGQGIWPAIWLFSAIAPYGTWPASGEVDIMEMVGHEPSIIYGTLHYGDDEEKQGSKALLPSQGFHIFALEWYENEMKWYVDDVEYFAADSWNNTSIDFPAPFDKPFNVVINLAIGGTWPGSPDGSTSFPQEFLIDYVRIYQK
jgi:beta-glucanase (GH16 family)